MKVLVTGGAGFIGHNFIDYLLRNTDWRITIIDRLDHSGNLNRLAEIGAHNNPRVRFMYHDLRATMNDQVAQQIGKHDYIVHLAAGTHVDRSITDPMAFVLDNVVATCNILDFARKMDCRRFLQFSTDEVFGPAPEGVRYKEDDRYNSGNPYAATKAGAEELAVSYHNTYGLPVIVTHTMNVYGHRQHFEKYVPATIGKVLKGETVLVHADKTKTLPGSRFYIHAQDVASAVVFLLEKGVVGEKYNLVGEREINNLQIAQTIAGILEKPLKYELISWHASRPGHDLRYALCGEKMRKLGWKHSLTIEQGLRETVLWTLKNPTWLQLESEPASAAA